MQYEIESRLKTAKEAIRVNPENAGEILRNLPAAMQAVASKIVEIEAMSRAELVRSAGEILDLWAAVNPAVSFEEPEGKGHEPNILAFREWMRVDGRKFMEDFFELVQGAPRNAIHRLGYVVDSLPFAFMAERQSEPWRTAAQKPQAGFGEVCRLLGMNTAEECSPFLAARAMTSRLAAWESVAPLALVKEKAAILGVHGALDSALLFSPVAIAVQNESALPRPPKDWEEEFIVAMGVDVLKRFQRISGLAVRATMAEGLVSASNERASDARWGRLHGVRERAFEIRKSGTWKSRAAAIRAMLPEIRAMAKAAGEPLSGDDPSVVETITRWFREAGIP